MNKFLLLFIFKLSLHAQFFEGFVVYDISIESEDDFIELQEFFGTVQKSFFYKDGNYFNVNNSLGNIGLYYDVDSNIIYQIFPENDTVYYQSAEKRINTCLRVDLEGSVDQKLLGMSLDKVKLSYTDYTLTVYFNKYNFLLNKKLYTLHKFGDWDTIVHNIEHVPLMFVYDFGAYKILYKAVEVVETPLPLTLFNVIKEQRVYLEIPSRAKLK